MKIPKLRQGGGIETSAGNEMEEKNPLREMKRDKKAPTGGMDLLRQEIEKRKQIMKPSTPEMNCGGLMGDGGMEIIIGMEEESGNEIPAGALEHEVADDMPAMLSEGEYVVPADVVRWHGLKALEGLRAEAKMGLGLMAQDGRIAEGTKIDTTEEGVEIEKAEHKIIKAAEGGDVTDEETAKAEPYTIANPYYQLQYRLDPATNRYKMVYVDTETGTEVPEGEFDPERASYNSPNSLIQREVYGSGIAEIVGEDPVVEDTTEDEEESCPDGYVKDASGACVPMNVTSSGGNFEQQQQEVAQPAYSKQLTTKIAESMGGLSAKDLKDQEGDTLAEKARSRMTQPTDVSIAKSAGIGLLTGGPLGAIAGAISGPVRQGIDAVGAKRAAITRMDELRSAAAEGDIGALGVTYNYAWDPATASFIETGGTKVTELSKASDGSAYVSKYNEVYNGREYNPETVDWDGKEGDDYFNDVIDSMDTFNETTKSVSGDETYTTNSTLNKTTGTGGGGDSTYSPGRYSDTQVSDDEFENAMNSFNELVE